MPLLARKAVKLAVFSTALLASKQWHKCFNELLVDGRVAVVPVEDATAGPTEDDRLRVHLHALLWCEGRVTLGAGAVFDPGQCPGSDRP